MDFNKVDLTSTNQKIFAGILVVGALFLLNYLLPPLVVLFANLWLLAAMAIPVVFIVMNPMLVWNIFKQLSWMLTKWLVSKDKLGYMYRYHDYLLGKIEKLDKSIESIAAIRIKTQRKIADINSVVTNNKKQAVIFEEQGKPETVRRTLANKINIDSKQLAILLPRVVSIEHQEKYLKDLHAAWVSDAEDLKYTLDAKAEEYQLLKEMNSATGAAGEFLSTNSEEFKIYRESLNQIEESVSRYTANIENFERKAKPVLESISANREVSEQEGLNLIEEFKKNSVNLKLA